MEQAWISYNRRRRPVRSVFKGLGRLYRTHRLHGGFLKMVTHGGFTVPYIGTFIIWNKFNEFRQYVLLSYGVLCHSLEVYHSSDKVSDYGTVIRLWITCSINVEWCAKVCWLSTAHVESLHLKSYRTQLLREGGENFICHQSTTCIEIRWNNNINQLAGCQNRHKPNKLAATLCKKHIHTYTQSKKYTQRC